MDLIFITNKIDVAKTVQAAGVDRVMVDLEINGKEARQGHLNTVISYHQPADIDRLRPHINKSELMVRVNPLHTGSKAEIDDVIARGADRLMLPMFRHPSEVEQFVDLVAGRVKVTLLMETATALARIGQIAAIDGVDDIHIGLNDLHLELGLDFMFEIFSDGIIDYLANVIKSHDRSFGIGGIGPIGTKLLLPSELILSDHIRLGSKQVILSRDYGKLLEDELGAEKFTHNIANLRFLIEINKTTENAVLAQNHSELKSIVRDIVNKKRRNQNAR